MMAMRTFFEPTLSQVTESRHESLGWCRSCGAECDGCEPDAQNYHCEECGDDEIYGGEEYLMRGWLKS